MKKAISVILALVMCSMFLAVSVSAAGINTYEQEVQDNLSQSIVVDGKTVKLPAEYYNQAKNYLMSSVDLKKDQADEVNGYVNEAIQLVKEDGTVTADGFSAEVNNAILSLAEKSASVVDLNLTYDGKTVKLVDSSNKVVFSNSAAIKVTGVSADVMAISVILVAALTMIGFVAVVAKKAKLF